MRTILLACVLLPVPGTLPLEAQEWIHDLKSSPDTYVGEEVTVEGFVAGGRAGVDGKGGSYFLVDASDASGIRVQTGSVPAEGSRYEVRGLVRRGERGEGILVLVETDRTRIGSSPLLMAVAGGSAFLTLLLLLLFFRARRDERRHLLGAPLWLLPASGPSPGGGSSVRLDPARDRADLALATQLGRRKRRLMAAVGAMTVATSSSAGWVAWSELSASSRAVFWQPSGFREIGQRKADTTAGLESPHSDFAPTVVVGGARRPPEPTGATAPGKTGSTSGASASASASASAPAPAPAPARIPPVVIDTPVVVSLPVLPPARVLPLPPPPPPPPAVDSAATRTLREEQQKLTAETAARALFTRLHGAVSRGDQAELAILWPPDLGSRGFRNRFFDFVKDFRPEASPGQFESPAILGDVAQSRGSIALSWRGDFGVTKTSTATFVLALRRSGESWTVEGIHLTDRFP